MSEEGVDIDNKLGGDDVIVLNPHFCAKDWNFSDVNWGPLSDITVLGIP